MRGLETERIEEIHGEIQGLVTIQSRLETIKMHQDLNITDEIELNRVNALLSELRKEERIWIDIHMRQKKERVRSKSFRGADEAWISKVTGVDVQCRQWTSLLLKLDPNVKPSTRFIADFEDYSRSFHLQHESARKILLNVFLLDILRRCQFNNSLRVFPQIELSAKSRGRRIRGKVDYLVGFDGKPHSQKFLLVIKQAAKCGSDRTDFIQCLAATAALYTSREDSGSVYGVLSDGIKWQFIQIDDAGTLLRSDEYSIDILGNKGAAVLVVYRVLHYMVKECYDAANKTRESALNTFDA